MATIDDILLYRAQMDAEDRQNNNLETAAIGALLGGASSASAAKSQQNLGDALRKLRGASKEADNVPTGTKVRNAIKKQVPVVKGGVAGAVLGGVLALIARQVAQRDSLAAELYAKRLSGEPMTAAELQATERVIADTVSRSSMV